VAIKVTVPHSFINNDMKRGYSDELMVFYKRLKELVKEYPTDKNIKITYHTHSTGKNNWHIKRGYIPGYLYFDKLGFAAWSELSKHYEEPDINLADVAEVSRIANDCINKGVTKIKQPTNKVKVEKPYILVVGQKPGDMVLDLAYINFPELLNMVKQVYEPLGYNVIFKPHPYDKGRYKNSVVAPIHDLLRDCEAVFTVNSGVGFEALLHHKRVFVSGNCEYKWVVDTVKNKQDIENTIDIMDKPVDSIKLVCFLHYCFNEFFVNVYDDNSIRKKLERTIEEFEA